jgi:hypothetical protein
VGQRVRFSKRTIGTILEFNGSSLDEAEMARELSRNPLTKDEFDTWKEKENKRKEKEIKNNLEANEYRKDVGRFIAHAGGQVGEYAYSNSLEALNASYENGFRIFELDIIKTSDDIYVAAHGWKHWAEIAEYEGDLPPSRNVFKKQGVYGSFTSLDMNDINSWFEKHSDAVLVTDKINTPMDFSKRFIDKNRLMMELFSWEAVKEGVEAGILSAMPTFDIVVRLRGNQISYLKEMGVTAIAGSRRHIYHSKNLIESLVDAGIKIYAFHLNFDEGIDESFSVCNEREYFYGIYADKWDFEGTLSCSKIDLKN